MKLFSVILMMIFLMSPAMLMFYLNIVDGKSYSFWQICIASLLFIWAWVIK